MKKRKIRGHKKKWKQITKWKESNLTLDLTLIKKEKRNHIKIWIHPWSGLSIKNSQYQEPNKKTKALIINSLLEIYKNWDNQLKRLNEPYYLKIWLYEPNISKSQVVCSIRDNIDFYKNTFNKEKSYTLLSTTNYPKITRTLLSEFNWISHIEEDHFDDTFVGEPSEYTSLGEYIECKNWFNQLLKRPHSITKIKGSNTINEIYSFKKGTVWIGELINLASEKPTFAPSR